MTNALTCNFTITHFLLNESVFTAYMWLVSDTSYTNLDEIFNWMSQHNGLLDFTSFCMTTQLFFSPSLSEALFLSVSKETKLKTLHKVPSFNYLFSLICCNLLHNGVSHQLGNDCRMNIYTLYHHSVLQWQGHVSAAHTLSERGPNTVTFPLRIFPL